MEIGRCLSILVCRIFRGDDGECVGKMKKNSSTLRSLVVFEKDVYQLKIGPNVDVALMVSKDRIT